MSKQLTQVLVYKSICVCFLLLLLARQLPATQPQESIAVDSSRVMGSPDPEPLEAEKTFKHLQFERPIELTYAAGLPEDLYVAEQAGRIYRFENNPDTRERKLFLDIRDAVSRDHNEEGLLGLAFHPQFKENGEFFVYYSTKPRASIVSRFRIQQDNPHQADPESEEILLKIPQPYGNHNGGSMKFGPDGMLYIGLGDGGLANDPHEHGQNLKTLLGSILRIDVDHRDESRAYAIPPDNPFAGREKEARGEIWAYGFRNVWRLAFDRESGELWAGDVGQDRVEEVNRVVKGGNYGWNAREGFHPFTKDQTITGSKPIPPIAEYFHGDGESVTGGLVYRGKRLPDFQGSYFYADYISGIVWAVPPDQQEFDGEQTSLEENKLGTDTTSPAYGQIVARTGLQISAFAEGPAGEMYLLAFDGKLHQLRERKVDLKAIAESFPKTLSETGLFQDVPKLLPVKGIVPYMVNLPLWSDGAEKERWLALPSAGQVKFHEREKWEFPVGTVFIKTFFQPTGQPAQSSASEKKSRLETRLFVHAPQGWRGYTYIWNEDQTEAHLLNGSATKEYTVQTPEGEEQRTWYFPSSVDCMACHTKAAGFVLGPTTRQFNRDFAYQSGKENQIQHLSRLKVFESEPAKEPQQLEAYVDWKSLAADENRSAPEHSREDLARAYLDVNCSVCHRPDAMGKEMDLRFHTKLPETQLINQQVRQETLGPQGTLRVKPGEPNQSEILHRMLTRGHRQMPPLATNVTDSQAITVVRQWIEQLPPAENPPAASK